MAHVPLVYTDGLCPTFRAVFIMVGILRCAFQGNASILNRYGALVEPSHPRVPPSLLCEQHQNRDLMRTAPTSIPYGRAHTYAHMYIC
eukprot:9499925-Pyramimonas_sp.AAC.1